MATQVGRLPRLLMVVALMVAWAMLTASSCNEVRPKAKGPDTTTTSSSQGASASDVSTPKGGQPADGSIAPKDFGPKAPALLFLTGLKGYTEPCGCTADIMMGGIDRITGFVKAYRELGITAPLVDTGNLLFQTKVLEPHMVAQEKAKTEVLIKAYKALGVRATVPGETDLAAGLAFYLDALKRAGLEAYGANVTLGDRKLAPSLTLKLGEVEVVVIFAAEPALYEGVEGVRVSAPKASVAKAVEAASGADAVVLAMHGRLAATKALLGEVAGIDFAIVGAEPRETDQVDAVGGGFTLEAYDQGRYLGVLKLYPQGAKGGYVNAGGGGKRELEKIERRIAHINASITKLPPAAPGEEPPILKRLRDQLSELERRRQEVKSASIEVPSGKRAFVYRPVGMAPGYPVDATIEAARKAYNAELKALNAELDREVIAPKPGEAFYMGAKACQSCHAAAYAFWEKTNHGHAFDTLVKREKDFDQNCIGCHVVGYDKPGGSVVGKTSYTVELAGKTWEKDLRHVGCENCHGPGSAHIEAVLTGKANFREFIGRGKGEEVCAQCHVPEHSPKFNYDVYITQITGEGHPLSQAP